jgi:hypothetical protein
MLLLKCFSFDYFLISFSNIKNPKKIYNQLTQRHSNMIKQHFLRAINPKLIGMFVKQNREAFDKMQEAYPLVPLVTSFAELNSVTIKNTTTPVTVFYKLTKHE